MFACQIGLGSPDVMLPPLLEGGVRNKGRMLSAVLSLAVAGIIALSGGEALASHISCGGTITADATLDSDLVNCPNNGIVIAADGVELDLNGHLIDGDGTEFNACSDNEFCDGGVVNDGHDGVTVRQGSVREFGTGVFVGGARHNRVLGIASSRNLFFGFLVIDAARSLVRGSSGNDNVAPDGDGMGLFGSRHVRVLDSEFRRNPLGVHVEDSPDNLVRGNAISRNGLGMLMQANRNAVRRNRCARQDACIIVSPGRRNVITKNRVFRGMGGVLIENGRDNVVARNFIGRVRRNGVVLFGGRNSVVRRNRVRRSGGDGFVVEEKADHSLLRRNRARRAGGDGFDVESRSTKLTRNRALRNADLGIEAVGGVIDGGRNIARHNGDRRQCTHISCR